MLDADSRQLERVAALVREVLGPDALGAYLFGSAVLGGLRPESDLDVLVLSRRPTSHEEKQGLVSVLYPLSGRETPSGRLRRIELTIVVESEIRPWRYPPSFDFQYGDWHWRAYERGEFEPWQTTTNPDLAVLITMVLLADTTIFGPPPAAVFEAVPDNDLVAASVDGLERLLADLEDDTRNVLLTLARIWSTVETGVIRSKDAAADWALVRLPVEQRPPLLRARAIYLGEHEERWTDLAPGLRAHADHVLGEIGRPRRRR